MTAAATRWRRSHDPAFSSRSAGAGVAELVDAREQQHEPEHRERQRGPGEEERPPLAPEHRRVRLRPVERHAPARRRVVAEAEELEARVDEERDVEDEHPRCGDPADHVRHELAEDDPPRRLAAAPAASTKSRLRSESACPRRIRASNAQRTSARTNDHRRHPVVLHVGRT